MPVIGGDASANTLTGTIDDDTVNGLGGDDTLAGDAGNDVLDGGADADILYGDYNSDDTPSAAGNDQLAGGAGADFLSGWRGNDVLDGGDGDDVLVTGIGFNALWYSDGSFGFVYRSGTDGGDDTLDGGTGEDDAYLFYSRADGITLDNSDTAAVNTIFAGGLATGSITGVERIHFYGGSGNDVVTAGDGDYDTLYGGGGNDTLAGGGGNDILQGGAGSFATEAADSNDILDGGAGTDRVDYISAAAGVTVSLALAGMAQDTGSAGIDTLIAVEDLAGSAFADTLTGDAGANDLNGISGDDTLLGNDGDDYLSGQEGNDRLEGGAGNDILSGWTGTDIMIGGAGNDSYSFIDAADVVTEAAGGGTDLVWASMTYTLGAHVENLVLTGSAAINGTGNALANSLTGNDVANILNGGGGADTLVGLGGNDTYYVDNAGDAVSEAAGGGDDRIFASVSYMLGAGVQVERLTTTDNAGTSAINLTGNAFADLIYGNAGANVLNGEAGADTLVGFDGDDWYYVDNAGDVVSEGAGGGAMDRIFASASYAMGAGVDVERLMTVDNAGTFAINLTGNELANVVYGNAAANVLDGRAGNDTLVGLAGNDTLVGGLGSDTMTGGLGDDLYHVDSAGDGVFEVAGQGTDRVFASVSYTLAASAQVELLTTSNNAGTTEIDLTGNGIANTIYGNAGANVLDGKGGADILVGLAGADSFAFTTALGGSNVDTVSGFVVADDTIQLDDAVFTGLAAGALASGAFATGTAATQADDRIVYNSATGALLFDADGVGGATAVQFATLAGGLALTSADFLVI